MLPKTHIIFGFLFSFSILFFFPQIGILGFIIIWASSVLIDIDHYLFYVWLKKDWSLKNSFKWFLKKSKKVKALSRAERYKVNPIPCFLHGIEAIILLSFLAYFFSPIFLYILIGFLIHEILDAIKIIYEGYSLRHVTSQIVNLIEFKKRGNKFVK